MRILAPFLSLRVMLMIACSLYFAHFIVITYWTSFSLHNFWFDEGTNYYYNAINARSWWQIFLADDSGYLNTPPRLISFILGRILNIRANFPLFFKVTNILLFSGMMSLLLAKRFDNYFGKNIFFRVAILALCALFPHIDFGFPFNSSYACLIPILYVFSELFEGVFLSQAKLFCYVILFPFLFISKLPYALLGLPVLAYCAVRSRYFKRYTHSYLSLWGLFCCVMQIFYYCFFFRNFYMAHTQPQSLIAFITNIAGIFDAMIGMSALGYGFKLVHNYGIFAQIITLTLGVVCLAIVGKTTYHAYSLGKIYVIEMMVTLLGLIGVNALLLDLNGSYEHAWNLLYVLPHYFYHRHLWCGFAGTILLLAVAINHSASKLKYCLLAYLFLVTLVSFVKFNVIQKYSADSHISLNPQEDLLASDWRSMSKVPLLNQLIIVNNYNAMSPVLPLKSMGIHTLYHTLVPFSFAAHIPFQSSVLYAADRVLFVVRVADVPKGIKHIQLTIETKDHHKAMYQPLYYSKISRYFLFDLGEHYNPSHIKDFTVIADSAVQSGWYDLIIYMDSN